jgi:hypothetical protein
VRNRLTYRVAFAAKGTLADGRLDVIEVDVTISERTPPALRLNCARVAGASALFASLYSFVTARRVLR